MNISEVMAVSLVFYMILPYLSYLRYHWGMELLSLEFYFKEGGEGGQGSKKRGRNDGLVILRVEW